MRSRKRRKKNTSTTSSLQSNDDPHPDTEATSSSAKGVKRSAAEMQFTDNDDTNDLVNKRSKKTNRVTIVVPSQLTSKEAKKFRKDERRKARADGILDDNNILFVSENDKDNTVSSSSSSSHPNNNKNNNEQHHHHHPHKESKKKSFPRINDLLTQHATIQKQATQTAHRNSLNESLDPTQKEKYIAIDCEMVGIGPNGIKSALARASAVDYSGNILLDTYVRVPERVTDFRTGISGVRPKDIAITNDSAMNHDEVRTIMEQLLLDKILVGHALKNDLSVLMISHPKSMIRDTARYKPFMRPGRVGGKFRPRKLRDLVAEHLGMEIQKKGMGGHSSVEDARASMELFKVVRGRWERELEGKSGKKRKRGGCKNK